MYWLSCKAVLSCTRFGLCGFHSLQSLIKHLTETHDEHIEEGEIQFSDFSLFEAWKEQEERMSGSLFVLKSAPQIYLSTKVWYYYCNRSGKYVPKSMGKRHIRSQGTSKIGQQCIAHIKVTKNLVTGMPLYTLML